MTDTPLFSELAGWLEAHVLVSTVLAAIGAITLAAIAISLLVMTGRALARMIGFSSVASNGTIRRAGQMPGYRILIGEVHGPRGKALAERVQTALETYMPDYSFGALFKLFRAKGFRGRAEAGMLAQARRKLKRTGADMLVWGEQVSEDGDGLILHGVSRAGGLSAGEATGFSLRLPGRARAYDEVLQRVLAVLLAKRLQPALSRPEAFRDEKVEGLGIQLDEMLAAHECEELDLPEPVRHELETDFTAIVLHLSQTEPRNDWLDKVITRRRAALEALKDNPDASAQVDARLDLGQALLLRVQSNFDPVAVREATVHLNAVIAALRDHTVIRRVQRASDGLQKAQAMVETRRRFAVNFSA